MELWLGDWVRVITIGLSLTLTTEFLYELSLWELYNNSSCANRIT